MKKIFLLFVIVIFGTAANAQIQMGGDSTVFTYDQPQRYEIGGVTVSGTRFLDEQVLINLSGLIVGDTIEIPGDKISKAIQTLWKQGLFSDIKIQVVRVQNDRVFLDLELSEKPRLSKFTFSKGVSKSEADKIREKIHLERDKVITENVLNNTKNTVRDFYIEKGFLNTKVDIREYKDTLFANRDILEIIVTKGKKVKIKDITFIGVTAIKEGKLRRAMKGTKTKRFYKIFTTSKFQESTFEEDKGKVIAKYRDKGYRDAKITDSQVTTISEKRLSIQLTIDEGHKYFFRNISWIGNTKHTSQELSGILAIKKGDVYDQSVLEERLFMSQNSRDVSSLYMDDGYLFFQVTPVEVKVENDSIDLEMRIYEGKQARINKVTVSGNTKTNDRVIIREIRTKPGQLFSRELIIRTQRELSQLGYFDAEKLGVNPKPNPADGTVDIEYVVEEKPSDQFELQGGYGANQLVGSLGVSFNNFSARNILKKGGWRPIPSGDGQRLSLRFQTNGKYYQSYNASFTEPWLGGKKPNSLSVSAYQTIQTNGRSKSDILRSEITISGGSVGLGKRLKWPDDYFSLYHELDYQYYSLHNYSSGFLFTNGYANNLYFQHTLSRNSIDQPIYPRSGNQTSLTLQWTPPYSLFNGLDYSTASDQAKYKFIEYHKWKFSSSWFTKIAGNLVLNVKAQYGFLGMYNRKVGPSPFERFYVGGDGLTAGFLFDGRELIGVRGYKDYSTITPVGGGTIFDKYTFELRYPVSLNPSATIYLLTFAEGANAWQHFKDFNPFSAKRAAGVGIRIFLPIFGLLGLDYGWHFNDYPGSAVDSKGHLSFTIGQQF
ncbi:MAG: outer membrane protein assembly factor BamA [Bacteroidota bacterium]